jgi:hypothetical protein
MTEQQLEYIALRLADILTERFRETPKEWVSQNQAWKMYGGRAYVERLRSDRKVRTRRECNRVEYYVKDLVKHLTPKSMILQTRKYNKKKNV